VVRRGFARELAAALPGGRCVELERGAHAVVFDAADDFNAEVVRFLSTGARSPAPEGPG
jgi:pimeloyl-ACP methyl ester carboxylesterase